MPELDRHFIVRAEDLRGALELLRADAVVEALRGAIAGRRSVLVRLHDYGVAAEIRGVACDERSIRLAMISAETIARAVAACDSLRSRASRA